MRRIHFSLMLTWCVCLVVPFHLGTLRPLAAQNLVGMVVGDVAPAAQWGRYSSSVTMDVTNVHGMLGDHMPETRVLVVPIKLESDEDSDPGRLLGAVQNLSVGPNDTLLFYYTGHGGADDRGHYLALSRGKLYRQSLRDALAAKGARLTVLITDCCNTRSDGESFMAPIYVPKNPPAPTAILQSLFLDPRGIVDINSSAPGESSFFTPISTNSFDLPGSLFSKAFTAWMEENESRARVWDELVREIGLRVHTNFNTYYPKGAQATKGQNIQTQQNVYPLAYPGMPEKSGPRTGFIVRDFQGTGAMIVSVQPGSPAAQVFVINENRFAPLAPQQVIISINGTPVANTEQLSQVFKASPQIARLSIRDAQRGVFDVLLRMRY